MVNGSAADQRPPAREPDRCRRLRAPRRDSNDGGTPRSIHPRWRTSALNGAFASDLERVIERHQPQLWIHGHVHDAVDTLLGETRVLANPRGYPGEGRRNGYRPGLALDI